MWDGSAVGGHLFGCILLSLRVAVVVVIDWPGRQGAFQWLDAHAVGEVFAWVEDGGGVAGVT